MKILTGIFGLIWKLYIGIVFVATAILFYLPIAILLNSEKNKKRAFRIFVLWSWVFRIVCFYGVLLTKKAELPEGPYIIVANHSSYLDIFLMYSIMSKHPFLFLGKSEILDYPLIKTYFKKMNIPVYRKNRIKAARALVMANQEVKKGWSIMIFPEGGIPADNNPKMMRFKDGAFQFAKTLNLPIVPMTFTNNYRLFSDPTIILGPARPGLSRVIIHETISSEKVQQMEKKELKQYCFDLINGPILEAHPEFRQ